MAKREILWRPMAKQARLLTCPALEVGYGGAPAGGKSDAMLIDALQGVPTANYRALILRRRFEDIRRSLLERSYVLYRGRASYNTQNKTWRFGNGSTIEFGHCQHEGDMHNYDSAQYHFIGVEQAEQFPLNMYLYFFTRLRKVSPEYKLKMRCNFNPGGVGHQWLRKRFWIHERPTNRIYTVKDVLKHSDGTEEELSYDRAFIPATVYDNEYIMKHNREYLMNLMQQPEPMRTAMLEGRFDLFEGQFFKEWDPKVHVCDPFDIPRNWRRSIAFDWGYSAPTCVLWFAEDPKARTVYVYKELYITGKIDLELAGQIEDLNQGDQLYAIYYPWDLDNTNPQTGVSMHERMDDAMGRRYYWKAGNKSRVNGWSAVRYLLSLRNDGNPRMKVFSTCSNLIRTIPDQVYGGTNSEDLDTDGEDHAVDALRYFAGTFRSLEEMLAEKSKDDSVVDLGGAIMKKEKVLSDGTFVPAQYMFKKEETPHFNWMVE